MDGAEELKRPASNSAELKPVRRLGRNRVRLGYRRIVVLLVSLVIVPTVLLLSVGLIMLFIEASFNFVFGILTVSFVAVMVTGVILVWVFVRREANLSELQADFVSKVSHEFRTPLTAIRLFAETMERAPDEDTAAQCRKMLIDETDRLSRLIERLLDWGRMESGAKMYEMRLEPVSAIVDDAVTAFSSQRFADAGLRFDVWVDKTLGKVRVDRAAIVDAITNLLSNARKYGGTPPTIALVAEPSGKWVHISVKDNGEGIPVGEHRRIFQKFYRIDDRLSRLREGSGLGLAIVKHIAQAHGGQVQVESTRGKGSTFTLVIPKPEGQR
jgi:two-component system phosphate regulon sensor histidine kinase PhoR